MLANKVFQSYFGLVIDVLVEPLILAYTVYNLLPITLHCQVYKPVNVIILVSI